MTMNGSQPPPRKNQTPNADHRDRHREVDQVLAGEHARGLPRIRPESLPNAITEPENVIAPMNVPMKSSSLLPVGMLGRQAERLPGRGSRRSR